MQSPPKFLSIKFGQLRFDDYYCDLTKTVLQFKSLCVLEFYGKTKKRHAIIRNNRNYLENNIQPTDELIASLLHLNCITDEQSYFIKRHRSTREKNNALLYVMETFNGTEFSNFVNYLRRTNQRTVAKILENGGGV